MDVLAGADFFTVEVLTWRGLITYYILFFIEVGSRRVSLGGITRHPDSCWMEQVARNATMEGAGYLKRCRYLLHDRDTKFCREFRESLAAGGLKCLALPARSPNLNSYAERWVRSVEEECLSKLILFGENSLRRAVSISLSTFIMNAIIRARKICSCSPPARLHLQLRSPQFGVTSGSVACSSTTAAPHEFFGHMGNGPGYLRCASTLLPRPTERCAIA